VYHVPTSQAGARMFGVEIHANAFESLYWNVSYREAGAMTEIMLISVIALTSSLIYAHLRWWWMWVLGAVLGVLWAIIAILRFDTTGEMLSLFLMLLAVVLPIMGNMLLDIVTETIRRERTEAQLKAEQDLSALRLVMIEEKDQQNQTLAELSMLKTQMIRMASHDLKNPLGIIITYGSLIQEDVAYDPSVMKPDHARFIDSMVKSAHDMLTIIEEILNLEQLRSGNIKKDPLAINYVVSAVVAQNQMESVDKNHTITLTMAENLPLVLADYRQLFQAITNLVGNAVKYTPDNGKIDVRVKMNGDMLRIEIQDNGYGISEEGQKNLFKEFYRVRSAKTAHIQGTGLGLSLVKAVIEAHNGKIWVESAEGVGSTFFVELPKFEGTLSDDA
jgi:signal transduction histidine kinase